MTRVIKVGQMPGGIKEYAVEEGTTFAQVLELAGVETNGFEIKADGEVVTSLDASIGSTNLLLLSKMIKGNAVTTVKVGKMPGGISEFAVDTQSTISDVLELSGFDTTGFEVKIDGVVASDLSQYVGDAKLILLSKMIKGNK